MATVVEGRSNRGLWIAIALIALIVIVGLFLLFANNREQSATAIVETPPAASPVVVGVGDGAAGAANAAQSAADAVTPDASVRIDAPVGGARVTTTVPVENQ